VVSVREILRTTREERQISLEQVQGELRIPLHYLEAMEGRTSKLIADEFYLVPFLRRYGDFLELDGASLVARFLAESARNEAAPSRSPMSVRPQRRWIWMAGIAVVLLAILLFWVLSNGATDDPDVGVVAVPRVEMQR
jgi:cytoskeletal protein RodZ